MLDGNILILSSPLFSDPFCEQHVTSLMQEMFLPAQNSDDHPLQQYAALALSFPRCHLWTNKLLNPVRNIKADVSGSKSVSRSFSEHSAVMMLGLWVSHFNYSGLAHVQSCLTDASLFYQSLFVLWVLKQLFSPFFPLYVFSFLDSSYIDFILS